MSDVGLTTAQRTLKRAFDFVVALCGLLSLWWLILACFIAASVDTRSYGFFLQERIGCGGNRFRIVKLKTMRPDDVTVTNVTRQGDPRITPLGALLRRFKLDELPQLWNVLVGEMSLVGPRPDVPGHMDTLVGEDRALLTLRPGITGPASLRYRNEEELLALQPHPERYNRDVIFPDKVKINLEYLRNWAFVTDLQIIWTTLTGGDLR